MGESIVMTKAIASRMSAMEVLMTFTDRGEQIFENVTVKQDYDNETTTLCVDDDFEIIVHNNDVYII